MARNRVDIGGVYASWEPWTQGARPSGADQPVGRLDDLFQPAGQLEVAKARQGFRGDPAVVVELVVENRLPGHPSGSKGHDQVVAGAGRGREHFAPAREADDVD